MFTRKHHLLPSNAHSVYKSVSKLTKETGLSFITWDEWHLQWFRDWRKLLSQYHHSKNYL